MRQHYKPSKTEWLRLYSLPYYLEGGKVIHFEGKLRYELDGSDWTVTQWEVT